MSRTTSAANGGAIAAQLRNWAQGCHSTEAAVELLVRARGGRFVEPGQPWLRTDDRGITRLDAEVIARYADALPVALARIGAVPRCNSRPPARMTPSITKGRFNPCVVETPRTRSLLR